jgi:hypothetical protein
MHFVAGADLFVTAVAPFVAAGAVHYFGFREEVAFERPWAVLASLVFVGVAITGIVLTGSHHLDTQYNFAVCRDGTTDTIRPDIGKIAKAAGEPGISVCGGRGGGVKYYKVTTFEHP